MKETYLHSPGALHEPCCELHPSKQIAEKRKKKKEIVN